MTNLTFRQTGLLANLIGIGVVLIYLKEKKE